MRRYFGTAAFVVALLCALTLVSSAQQPRGGYGNADAITQDELKQYDYFLASDQLEGRNVPSRGYDIAALFIASRLMEWGVKPAGSATGTNGPLQAYLMPIELVSNQLDASAMKLTLTMPAAPAGRGGGGAAGPRALEYAKEWTLGAGGGGRGGAPAEPADINGAPLVFVGHGYVINKTNTNPYKGLDVKGKIMIVAGVPTELVAARNAAAAGGRGGGGGRGAAAPNPLGVENTDFTTPQTYAAKNGAKGIVMIPTFQQLAAMAAPATGRGAGPNGPPYQVVQFQAARPAAVPVITAGAALTNALFQGEKLNGAQVFEGGATAAKLDSFDLNAAKKLSLHVDVTSLKGWTENVIGMVEGSDPVLKNEYVVMSAHLDHNGVAAPNEAGDSVFNGADDDGSGSAALMAIARVYAQGAAHGIRPKRTMIFLWVSGEEKGLWGSQYFNRFPPVDITKVVADLNMDMIGRSKTPGYVDPTAYKLADPGELFVVGPNISSDELGKIVDGVATKFGKLKLNHFYDTTAPDATHDNLGPQPNGQRIFYRSDHYNFAKCGIPIVFYTTGLHVDYHRVTDSPEKLDYSLMQTVAKNVAAVGWTLANSATRPKLNTKLPDQLVTDMKAAKDAGWGKLTPVRPPLPGMPF
ncbi:MAG: M28 family peptidase [Acidobacteria bacterium]|nr:M28 family peptidase [Acidobacteriota bacterium]